MATERAKAELRGSRGDMKDKLNGRGRVSSRFLSVHLCTVPREQRLLVESVPRRTKGAAQEGSGATGGGGGGGPRGYVLSPSLSLGPAGSVGRGLGGHGDPGVSSRVRGGRLDSPPLTLPTSACIPILVSAAPPSGARGKRRRDLVRAHTGWVPEFLGNQAQRSRR